MDIDEFDLSRHGAPGFTLNCRLDMSGHPSGLVDPHFNTDIVNPSGNVLGRSGPGADFRDLNHIQLPGLNGMQRG